MEKETGHAITNLCARLLVEGIQQSISCSLLRGVELFVREKCGSRVTHFSNTWNLGLSQSHAIVPPIANIPHRKVDE